MITGLAPPGVSLRPLREDEIGALAHAIDDELTEAQVENRWHEQELGYRELLVAVVDGAIVGTVSISDSTRPRNSLHLFALEVSPDVRGQGIGTAIIRSVLAEAQRRGRARVYLEVRVDNPARRLYHRLGFRRTGPSFVNAWWRFESDGSRERVEEASYRMVKRVARAAQLVKNESLARPSRASRQVAPVNGAGSEGDSPGRGLATGRAGLFPA